MLPVYLSLLSFFDDIYVNQVIATGCLAVLVIGTWALNYIRPPLVAMFCYFTVQALLLPQNPVVGYFAAREVIFWTLLFAFVHITKPNLANPWLIPSSIALSLIKLPIFFNTSLNLCWLVALLPFAPPWQFALVATYMLLKPSGLSAPLMFLVVVLCHFKGRALRWAALSGAALMGALVWLHPRMLMAKVEQFDRFDFWEVTAVYFMDRINGWFGAGLGSFTYYGPKITAAAGWPIQTMSSNGQESIKVWLSAHNDYLQWGFETGVLGMLLGIWLVLDCLERLPPTEVTCLLAIGVCALGYFPLDCPAFALLLAVLIYPVQSRSKATSAAHVIS